MTDNKKRPDWTGAKNAAKIAMGQACVNAVDHGALQAAIAVFEKLENRATDEAERARDYIMEHMKYRAPEAAYIIWSSESPISDPVYDKALEDHPDADVALLDDMLNEQPEIWRGDEMANLNTGCPEPIDIIVIADNGRWNGRFVAATFAEQISLGKALLELPVQRYHDEFVVYAQDGQINAEGIHHDATDKFLILEITDVDAMREGIADYVFNDITGLPAWAKSLYPRVAGIYGWPQAAARRDETGDDHDAG